MFENRFVDIQLSVCHAYFRLFVVIHFCTASLFMPYVM